MRADDLLALEFELVNARLSERPGEPPTIVPISEQALLIIHFPPQHIAEESGFSASWARARMAGPSRLAFRLLGEVPFTLQALLNWDHSAFAAYLPAADSPLEPLQTTIELPFRLLLAPDREARWQHRRDSAVHVAGDGSRWVELWHTKLAAEPSKLAVWAAGARLSGQGDPFATISLSDTDRQRIASQSRARTAANDGHADIPAGRLVLSSLGGWLEAQGSWPPSAGPLAEWRHDAAMGRDQSVRVVTRGYLFPFGHRAGYSKITERTFSDDGTAHLVQRHFLTVLEPEKAFEERNMPLRRVRIETDTTPLLDSDLTQGGWPVVGGVPFEFQLTGIDWAGRQLPFALSLGFVPAVQPSKSLIDGYRDIFDGDRPRRRAWFRGQKLTFAQAAPNDQATTLVTHSIDFDAVDVSSAGPMQAPFKPFLDSAAVELASVSEMFGVKQPVEIKLARDYLDAGFDEAHAGAGNRGQLFAELVGSSLPIQPIAQQVGGFLAPKLNVVGLSRSLGPISAEGADTAQALAQFGTGQFDPAAFLGSGTKLFGTINLLDLIPNVDFQPPVAASDDQINVEELLKQVNLASPADRSKKLKELLEVENRTKLIKVPMMSTGEIVNELGLPAGAEITYLWKPKVTQPPAPLGDILKKTDDSQFWIVTRLAVRAGEDPDFRVEGHFTRFSLHLLSVMVIDFARVSFRTERGKSVDFRPEVTGIAFRGPLKFVNDLKEVLAAVGVDSPFGIVVQPSHVIARYDLALPSFSLGVFAIENVKLSAALTLPFLPDAGPISIRFAVGERAAPFLVTYSIFAGGGFFALTLDTGGGVGVEASIEFGGKFSINLVVASGGVFVMAGIYFSLTSREGVKLEGYLRAGGFVDILGIAGVSIEFYLGLRYEELENVLVGFAKVTACIEVLFFSECVGFDVEYKIAGPSLGDDRAMPEAPLFIAANRDRRPERTGFSDLIDLTSWKNYCVSFA